MTFYRALLLILLLSNAALSTAEGKIRFFCGLNANSNFYSAYSELYKQAFASLGYDFEMLQRPLKRVTADLASGAADGDCGRVSSLNELLQQDSFIRVNTQIARVHTGIWTYNPSIQSITEVDLVSKAYRIGVMRGALLLRAKLKSLAVEFEELDSPAMGLKMLYAGRIDVFIAPNIRIDATLELEPDIQSPKNVGNLLALDIYPYLNERHKHLAQPLAAALQSMLADPDNKVHKYSGLLSKP